MTGEGSEYGRKGREGQHEGEDNDDHRRETKDLIDEIEREDSEGQEKNEQSEEKEEEYQEQVKKMIDEAKEEHARDVEDAETNEDRESEWNKEAEKCVQDAIKEFEREETEEKRAREAVEEESKDELEDESGLGRTEDAESYHDDGSGQLYATKAESSEQAECKTESENSEETKEAEQEPAEAQESSTSQEYTEPKKKQSEIEEPAESEAEETEDQLKGRSQDSVEEPEPPEASTKDGAESKYQEKEMRKNTTAEYSEEMDEVQDETNGGKKAEKSGKSDIYVEREDVVESSSESEHEETTEPKSTDESEKTKQQSEPGDKSENFDESIENTKTDESTERDSEPTSEVEREISEPENNESTKSETEKEDMDKFVERVKELLDEKPEQDDNYDYVQDPLTGEMQRVPKILSDYETDEQKQRRKLRNLFAELSEEERERFKEIVREETKAEGEKSAEKVEEEWNRIVEEAEQSNNLIQDEVNETAREVTIRWHSSACSVEDVRRLYYDENLSKSEIARKLGIANSTIHRIFEKNKWKSRPWPKKRKPKQAYKLYKLGLTHKEIAEEMGVARRTVGNYLRELGVKRKIRSNLERKQYRRIKSKERVERIKQLRDDLFGTECRICGATREKRKLAIHSKDFKEHKSHALWSEPFLQKVIPDEWVALCIMCHRGVHWIHDDLGIDWKSVERYPKKGRIDQFQDTSSKVTLRTTVSEDQSVEEIRKALFGNECFFCGPIPKEKILVIHRKDGKPHRRHALNSKQFLFKMNTDDWQLLCQKHHRYVHWGMKHLSLTWDNIESAFRSRKRNNLHEGEKPNQ